MARVCAWSITVLVTASCAARGASPQLVAEMARADLLLREGCYRCLEEAAATYVRLATLPRAPVGARQHAFDATLLLAVRAKELGIPADPLLQQARELAQQLPATVPPALPPAASLDAAEFVVGETSGLDPERRQQRVRRPRPPTPEGRVVPPARAALTPALPSSVIAEYLALAIDCEDPFARPDINAEQIRARHGDPPLIRFRLAICGTAPALLAPLREADARWVDTFFFEGRRQMAARPIADVLKASEYFTEARTAFPDSDAITLALAAAQNALSEHEAALANFDVVLAKEPTHRDALLGRVMSLSYLNRYPDAVVSATRLIDLGTWHIGDAYYWRAWNRYHLHQLDAAWADVERATGLLVNTSVYTLAGFIAYARKELDTAIERLDRAFAMDKTNCEAVWTASLVHVDQEAWPHAAPKFSRAMSCFSEAAAQAQAEIKQLEAAAFAEALKARRIAAAQKRVETSHHRSAQAAFNAAGCYLRLGQKTAALHHVDAAAEHALMKEKAVALRTTIEKLPE